MVYLGAHSHGKELTPIDYDRVTDSHYEFLGSFLGRLVCVCVCVSCKNQDFVVFSSILWLL